MQEKRRPGSCCTVVSVNAAVVVHMFKLALDIYLSAIPPTKLNLMRAEADLAQLFPDQEL